MSTGYNAINFKNKDIDKFATKFGKDNGGLEKNKVDYSKQKNIRYDPSKDYTGKRNILGQQKSRVSTETETVNKKGKPGVTKTLTTTKTRSISPNRTAVVGPGRTVSSKSRGSDHKYYTQKTKVKTVKNKNLDEFLEKNPDYKVTDGNLKTKTRTEKLNWDKGKVIRKNIPPSSGEQWTEWKDTTTDRERELGLTSRHSNLMEFQSQDKYDYPKPKVTKDKTVKVEEFAQARRAKAKNLIGIRTNKVKK